MAPVSRQATGSLRQEAMVSQKLVSILWLFLLDLTAYNHGLKGPQKPKTYCDNTILRSYLSPSVFTVRSGPVWRQDLAILSPEGPRDNTCQLRACMSAPLWRIIFVQSPPDAQVRMLTLPVLVAVAPFFLSVARGVVHRLEPWELSALLCSAARLQRHAAAVLGPLPDLLSSTVSEVEHRLAGWPTRGVSQVVQPKELLGQMCCCGKMRI